MREADFWKAEWMCDSLTLVGLLSEWDGWKERQMLGTHGSTAVMSREDGRRDGHLVMLWHSVIHLRFHFVVREHVRIPLCWQKHTVWINWTLVKGTLWIYFIVYNYRLFNWILGSFCLTFIIIVTLLFSLDNVIVHVFILGPLPNKDNDSTGQSEELLNWLLC